MKAKNESEFLALKLRYETITIEEIEREWYYDGKQTLSKITGYGDSSTCSVCKPINDIHCYQGCVYAHDGEQHCSDDNTYGKLTRAESPSELLTACRNRAIHMGKVWEKYVKQLNNN